MRGESLVLLTLDLEISNLWENALAEQFPETDFIIQNAQLVANNSFSGLLTIKNGNFKEIKNFLMENFPKVSIETFHKNLETYFYIVPGNQLARVVGSVNCIMTFPIKFEREFKKIKVILKEKNVEEFISLIEKKNINVLKISKVKIDFGFNEVLTPKQKEILVPSLKFGYYEFPKKINLNGLAEKLSISPSTLCVHLQKIESKIFNSDYSELFLRSLVI